MTEQFSIHFADPVFLWFLVPAAVAVFFCRRRTGRLQLTAAALLLLGAAGPVVGFRRTGPEITKLTVPMASPADGSRKEDAAAFLARTGAGMKEGGAIHLHGPCEERSGSVARSAALLADRGIPVRLFPAAGNGSSIRLRDFPLPLQAGPGETVRFSPAFAVPAPGKAELRLESPGLKHPVQKELFFSAKGDHEVPVQCTFGRPGIHIAELKIDGRVEARKIVNVTEPCRVLLISGTPEYSAGAVRRLLGENARVYPYASGADFGKFPLVVMTGGSAEKLSKEEFLRLAAAVRGGTGLMIFTGRNARFDEGKVPREFRDIMPSSYSGRVLNRIPVTALVIIIDTSGSMSGVRIALAREVARLAIDKLQDHDLAGIVEFHGRRRWAAPIQSAANHLELHRALNRLNAGGGTVIMPAVQEAFYALRNTDARLKHILIITDGGVEQGPFEKLFRQMARNDITVSTVLSGRGESAFLEQLALWGNGRFYTASSRFALPELTFRQTGRENLPPVREGDFPVKLVHLRPPFVSLTPGSRIGGLAENKLNPGAVELLRAAEVPLLAVRYAGAGAVGAFNSELEGPWTESLRRDRRFSGMLAAFLRSLPEPVRMNPFTVRDLSLRRDVHLQIESRGAGEHLYLELRPRKGKALFCKLTKGPDGAFHFRRSGLEAGIHRLKISFSPDLAGAAEFGLLPFEALPGNGITDAACREINARSARITPLPGRRTVDLRSFFSLLALAFMLAQIFCRRLPSASRILPFVLLFSALDLTAGEYENALRQGLRGIAPETSFRRAASLAANAADRRFALNCELEYARRQGTLKKLLARWCGQKDIDPEQLELLICELEDSVSPAAALEFLEERAPQGEVRFASHLLRLAEKCDRTAMVRELARRKLNEGGESLFWLAAALRLELLQQRREEAKHLFLDYLKRENDVGRLSHLADAAENAALYECVGAVLDKWEKRAASDVWPVRFRRLDALIRQGRPESAAALLRNWAAGKKYPAGVMMNLADRCEQLGEVESAVSLYRKTGGEEAQLRLAMLFDGSGRRKESAPLWHAIVRNSSGEMRSRQAMERLVANSAAEKELPRLCKELLAEYRRTPSRRLLLFTCRALAAAGRNGELYGLLDDAGEKELKLSFLLEERKYAEAAALLEAKYESSPAEREEILRRLTIIAVESGDKLLARKTLDRLLATARNRREVLEFAAGVCMLLDDPARAGEMYDQCLKSDDSQIELYLLRANAWKAAGEKERALKFFAGKVDQPLSADLFGVMADGLLNMEAPPPLLRKALEAALRRIEADPDLLFYYRLAEDLAEELGDTALWRRLQTLQLAAGPGRRALLLRGLYEDALQRNDTAQALHFARLLIGLKDVYPPDLYSSLARTLTANGCYGAAERCARQADAAENTTSRLFALTRVCMDSGRLADARRICRELLSLEPRSPELLARYAEVLEFSGDYLRAGEENLKALRILAARQAVSVNTSRGSSGAAFAREIKPLLHAFANQAVLYPEHFEASLEKFRKEAAPAARARVWIPLKQRIDELKGLTSGPKRNRIMPRRQHLFPDAESFAVTVLTAKPAEAVRLCRELFARLPLQRRGAFLTRLIGTFGADPLPEVEKALLEILSRTKLPDAVPLWSFQPRALTLKKAVAAQLLRQKPDSLPALVLSARLRWLSGDPAGARALAAECCGRFSEAKTITFQDVRAVRSLGIVFAARPGEEPEKGKKSLEKLAASLESDRELLGDTPPRVLLCAVLLECAGDADGALKSLFRLWRTGERTVIVSRMTEELTVRTGAYRQYLELLEAFPPKDPTVRILTARRQIQLYREYGMAGKALALLDTMPQLLRKREQLLIARRTLPPENFAAALSGFLIDQCRAGSYIGFFPDNFGLDGMKGLRRRGTLRPDLLPELGRFSGSSALKRTMEYLIAGVPVSQRGAAVLFHTWRSLPAAPGGEVRCAGKAAMPQLLPLKAASGGRLSSEERALLRKNILQGGIPLENALVCLEALPEKERRETASVLAEQTVSDLLPLPRMEQLEKLIAMTDPARRKKIFASLAKRCAPGTERQLWEFLFLLKRHLPECFDLFGGKAVARPFSMTSELYLLYGPEAPEERFLNFLACAEEFPDWQKMLVIAGPESSLTDAAGAAVITACRRRLITPDAAVRHFVLLSVADSRRKKHWLALAARYDLTPGEATVWRLDASGDPAEKKEIETRLLRAGKMPPARLNGIIHPKTGKEKEK